MDPASRTPLEMYRRMVRIRLFEPRRHAWVRAEKSPAHCTPRRVRRARLSAPAWRSMRMITWWAIIDHTGIRS